MAITVKLSRFCEMKNWEQKIMQYSQQAYFGYCVHDLHTSKCLGFPQH